MNYDSFCFSTVGTIDSAEHGIKCVMFFFSVLFADLRHRERNINCLSAVCGHTVCQPLYVVTTRGQDRREWLSTCHCLPRGRLDQSNRPFMKGGVGWFTEVSCLT